jgi:hypothetical protein
MPSGLKTITNSLQTDSSLLKPEGISEASRENL